MFDKEAAWEYIKSEFPKEPKDDEAKLLFWGNLVNKTGTCIKDFGFVGDCEGGCVECYKEKLHSLFDISPEEKQKHVEIYKKELDSLFFTFYKFKYTNSKMLNGIFSFDPNPIRLCPSQAGYFEEYCNNGCSCAMCLISCYSEQYVPKMNEQRLLDAMEFIKNNSHNDMGELK